MLDALLAVLLAAAVVYAVWLAKFFVAVAARDAECKRIIAYLRSRGHESLDRANKFPGGPTALHYSWDAISMESAAQALENLEHEGGWKC